MSTICDDLRAAILSAAMQGKLTRQLPEDGDVEELLAEIESKRKTTNKKIKPISSKEELFEIPNNWKWERFGKIVDFNMGKTPPRAEASYWGNDISWVSIADMPENDILLETKEKISNKAFKDKFNSKICPKGTLIMSFKLTVGRCSILGIDAVHNEAIISINPIVDSGFTFRDYLARALPFLSNYGETKDAIKGRTLNSDSLNNLLIPVPPLAEQKRIVEKVDELMARVADLEQSADALASLKKAFPDDIKASLLQAAMQGKLTKQLPEDGSAEDLLEEIKAEKEKLPRKKKDLPVSDDEIPFEIPDSWRWQKLENISTFIGDKSNQIKESLAKKEGKYKVVSQSKELFIGYYDDERKLLKVDHPVLVFGDHTALVKWIDFDFIIGADGVKVIDPICVDIKYLYYTLKYLLIGVNELGGYSRHYKYIKDKLIPLPPLAEQKRISECLDAFMQSINVVGDLIASE